MTFSYPNEDMSSEIEDLLQFCAQFSIVSLMAQLPISQITTASQIQEQKKIKKSKFEKPSAKKVVRSKFQKPSIAKKQIQEQSSSGSQSQNCQENVDNDINYFINHLSSNANNNKLLHNTGLIRSSYQPAQNFESKYTPYSNLHTNSAAPKYQERPSFHIPDFTQKISKVRVDQNKGSFTDRNYTKNNQRNYEDNQYQKSMKNFNMNQSKFIYGEDRQQPMKRPQFYNQFPPYNQFQIDRSQLSYRNYEPNLLYESPNVQNKNVMYSPVRKERDSIMGGSSLSCALNLSPQSRRDGSTSRTKRKNVERPFYEPPKSLIRTTQSSLKKNYEQRDSQLQINEIQKFQIDSNRRTIQTEVQYVKKPTIRKTQIAEMNDELKDYLTMASQYKNVPHPIQINLKQSR